MALWSLLRLAGVISGGILITAAACSAGGDDPPTLVIGGIPDQDVSLLEERFDAVAKVLSEELGIDVEYRPAVSYAALVAAFRQGDIGLGWFGGLTGVQARLADPGAVAIAQRPRDEEFRSVFIVGRDVAADTLADLRGVSFTFGSESSTSGHLMPRSFLVAAGIDPERDFDGPPSYSGSHDRTWKEVEAGVFDAGALSQSVWERAVREGQVDTSKVRVLQVAGPYFDYHWVAGSRLDDTYGAGTVERIQAALTGIAATDPGRARLLELFQTDSFIDTKDSNYQAIERTARALGLIE